MNSPIFAVGLLILASTLTEANWFDKDPFDELNTFLVKHEQSNKLEANIKAAKQLLDGERKESEEVIALARQLIALEVAHPINLCSSESAEVVLAAFKGMKSHVSNPFNDERRLAKLIVGLAQTRAEDCFNKLVKQFCEHNACNGDAYFISPIYRFATAVTNAIPCPMDFNMNELNQATCAIAMLGKDLNIGRVPSQVYQTLSQLRGSEISQENLHSFLNRDFHEHCSKMARHQESQQIVKNIVSLLSTIKVSDQLFGADITKNGAVLDMVGAYVTCERLAITDRDMFESNISKLIK